MKKKEVFGEAIRVARIRAGISQAELSRRLGVAVGSGYVSRLEVGGKVPSVLMCLKLADVLGVGIGVLLEMARVEFRELQAAKAERRWGVGREYIEAVEHSKSM